jgi:hypothetical protein
MVNGTAGSSGPVSAFRPDKASLPGIAVIASETDTLPGLYRS